MGEKSLALLKGTSTSSIGEKMGVSSSLSQETIASSEDMEALRDFQVRVFELKEGVNRLGFMMSEIRSVVGRFSL